MILGICGFGYSGSGAILDLLKESSKCEVCDSFEFSMTYKPDGLEDLEWHITQPSRYFSSDSAIRRFIQYKKRIAKRYDQYSNGQFSKLADEYIKKITTIKWYGSTSVHIYQSSWFEYVFFQMIPRRLRGPFERKIGRIPFVCPPYKTMYYSSVSHDVFLSYTIDFVMGFVNSIRKTDKRVLVLDQPFSADNPRRSMQFFTDSRAIIIVRDPRDVYLLAKKTIGMTAGFIPTNDVELFIKYYKGLMSQIKLEPSQNNILKIRFEDLIYKTNSTIASIRDFVGVDDIGTGVQFKPEKSINNTQLFLKYQDFKSDIDRISLELSDYLYPFADFSSKPSFNHKSF